MDSIAANPVSLRSASSRMDLHLPAGSAGPWMHWSTLPLLAPRPHTPSQNHHLAGHASGAGRWDLAAGQRHGFPTPTTANSLDYNDEANSFSSWPGRLGVLQV